MPVVTIHHALLRRAFHASQMSPVYPARAYRDYLSTLYELSAKAQGYLAEVGITAIDKNDDPDFADYLVVTFTDFNAARVFHDLNVDGHPLD